MRTLKQVIAFLLVLLFLFSCVSCGKKEDTKEEVQDSVGLAFKTNYDGTCSLTGIGSCQDTAIVIPSVNPETNETVVRIENNAFEGQTQITSVTFPSTITEIGYYAFARCTSITQLFLPDGLISIRNFAFSKCSSVTWVYLGGYLEEIGDSAFAGCNSMKYAFYRGTASNWSKVRVGALNSAVTMEGILYFYSSTRPTSSGNYWYYNSGSFRIW